MQHAILHCALLGDIPYGIEYVSKQLHGFRFVSERTVCKVPGETLDRLSRFTISHD